MTLTSFSFFQPCSRLFLLTLSSLWLIISPALSQTVLSLTANTASQTGTTGNYTVPSGGPYKLRITAKGASGGNGANIAGGLGATMIGEFIVLPGQVVNVLAGAPGGNTTGDFTAGGGGGGSGAQLANGTPLLIAGGGGGAIKRFNGFGTKGGDGQAINSGNQGGAGSSGGGGGGGFASSGGGGTKGATGGEGGFYGRGGSGDSSGGFGGGGFGGGGGGAGGSFNNGGGGGGGYSGGNGNGLGIGGDGGGSINYGTNPTNTAGNNNAGGAVMVELLGLSAPFAPNISAIQPACGSTTGGVTIDLTGDFNNSTNSVEYAIVSGSSFSGSPTFTTISAEPLSITSGTGTQATIPGSTYTVRVRLIYNPTIYTDYTYTLTLPPTRLYVKTTATGTNTGQSWQNAFTDLQLALNYATTQCLTEIWVAAGTYKPTTSTNQSVSFSMKNGVAIYGGFVGTEANLSDRPTINPVSGQPSSSTLSGDIDNGGTLNGNSQHLIYNPSGIDNTAVLNGFVITGGNASDTGGGMFNDQSSPTVTNCSFLTNSASKGGAIYSINSTSLVLTNCFFSDNSASSEGGAIDNQTSQVTLINCGFLNNQAAGLGGGILNYNSTLRVINGSWQNNTAFAGGAILTFNGVVTLSNCVAFGNGGSNTFTNYVNNSNPSGFTATYSLFEPSSVTVTGMDVSGPGNLTTTSSPFASTATVVLNQCALAINTGSNAAYSSANGPATDLNGQDRNYNGSVIDMGAIEYQGAPNLQTGFSSPLLSGSAVCVGVSVTTSLSVSGTGPFTYQWYKGGSVVNGQTTATLSLTNVQTSDGGSYSVVVTGSCNSVTSTAFSLTVNAIPTVSINPTSATLTSASPTVSLTAIGSGTYQWSTGEISQVISVTSSGVYSVTLTSPGGCTASASASVPGSDLTVNLELPQAQFGASGTAAVGNFVVNVFEVGGLATSSGNVTITITAPVGYTLSFVPTLTSIDVSGGSRGAVNNGVWTVSHSVEARQLSLTMNSGAFIGAGGKSSLGLSLTRTTANSGSTANITVNVADDLTMRYDGNLSNNVYARIISGL